MVPCYGYYHDTSDPWHRTTSGTTGTDWVYYESGYTYFVRVQPSGDANIKIVCEKLTQYFDRVETFIKHLALSVWRSLPLPET